VAGGGRFRKALAALEAKERSDHVRILWLGDSHTAADLWTGEVRRALQRRYGDGGPGFVHAGWSKYRHEQVQTRVSGRWRTEPGDYARMKPYDDGLLGLGGVRHVPREPGATATLEARKGEGPFIWEVAYRLPPGAALQVTPGEEESETMLPGGREGEILHRRFTTRHTHRLSLRAVQGKPQVMGVTVEASKPGVVLDTIGLNGARVGTFLAWDEEGWVKEVKLRRPDLVVLAFGTNESSDVKPEAERYEEATRQLLKRVRRGAPESDCLVITPIDRAGAEYGARLAVIGQGMRAAATEAGCAVWDAQKAMGGAGGMERWAAESPARGGADGVHLTARGYQSLGESLARELLTLGGLPSEPKDP
jgi:lysophospholipase L1-like esterase